MSEIFVVFPPLTNNSIIYGRNSFSFCCKEILRFAPNESSTTNIEVAPSPTSFGYILNGTCGSNDKNLSISTLFADNKPENGLSALDLTKLVLERSDSAEKAIDIISNLINQYNHESVDSSPKYGFFICDTKEAYVMNVVGKMWAAEQVTEGFRAFGKGFAVTTKIDKKSDGLEDKLKELGLFDGGELNFSKAFSMDVAETKWPTDEPSSGFSAQKMFEVLRASAEGSEPIASSFVSVLKEPIAVYWFTGTPDPRESVFKPFIFTNDVVISPLTSLKDNDDDETLLRKLHANRKWDQVGELLKTLEKSCVDEVDGYVDNAPTDELNELLKDCVEAEVKFYR